MTMLLLLLSLPALAEKSDVRKLVEQPVQQAIDLRQATQKSQEQWQDQKQKLAALYESLQQEQTALEAQKKALVEDVGAGRGRIAVKAKQLADSEQITTQLGPFLQTLLARLRDLVKNDAPFLVAERQQRIDHLELTLNDPDVSVSEKCRKMMEALVVEAEYGQTIEVYQQTITVQDQSTLVQIFRLGRVALFYQTLDRHHCGFYNVAGARFEPLSKVYNRVIQSAMDIGAKRQPVELLTLPIGRMAVQ